MNDFSPKNNTSEFRIPVSDNYIFKSRAVLEHAIGNQKFTHSLSELIHLEREKRIRATFLFKNKLEQL